MVGIRGRRVEGERQMAKAIFGKKIGMTQVFNESGESVAVTVIEVPKTVVVRKRTKERDGYEALQVGFGEVARSRVTKPYSGQFREARMQATRHLKELRHVDCSGFDVGSQVSVDQFEAGERIEVSGTSKGKGYQGTIKRHGFHRGPMAHGSKSHRRPASGGSTDGARVFPGKRGPGQMGGERVTIRGLRIERVVPEKGLLLVRGAVPGANGSLVEIRSRADGIKG